MFCVSFRALLHRLLSCGASDLTSLLILLALQVAHEMGVLAYRAADYPAAAGWLERALSLRPEPAPCPAHEPTLVALGHAYRKLQRYGQRNQGFD